MILDPSIFEFLKKLKINNNRPWFKENKSIFDSHNKDVKNSTNCISVSCSTNKRV